MKGQIAQFALIVRDYDEAIKFYTEQVGFDLIEDTSLDSQKRCVVVAPYGSMARLLLAKASSTTQSSRIGDQAGGRVLLFLETDDFWPRLSPNEISRSGVSRGATGRGIRHFVAVFQDLYGNKWDLLEPKGTARLPRK
jgi:catechol 2,3-dioxygenase-like lactoylglutathione lyase family enzyme